MIKIETKRQYIMELWDRDLPELSALLQDDQTMSDLGGVFSNTEIHEWLDEQSFYYQNSKYGIWAAMLKRNVKLIGCCGITRENVDGLDVFALAYLYHRDYRHKGYAAEAAKSCIRYAFEVMGFSEILAVVRDTDFPSMNVAIRSGMMARGRIMKQYCGADTPHMVFSIKREAKAKAK